MNDINIYVADLAAYNAGYLHGKWIDATLDPEDIYGEINKILASSPVADSEEYAIHDYEGFEGASLSEYEGIESAHEKACFIEEHGKLGAEILNYYGDDLGDAEKALEDHYSGCYKSLADYAEELTEQTSKIPENLAYYIDYEKMGRDMEYGGDVFTIETGFEEVHIFWSH